MTIHLYRCSACGVAKFDRQDSEVSCLYCAGCKDWQMHGKVYVVGGGFRTNTVSQEEENAWKREDR